MQKFFAVSAALLGALGVVLGAFGAHYLKNRLSVDALTVFETGVRYQMYHVFALLGVSIYGGQTVFNASGWSFIVGILLFSGSLYLIALMGWRQLGMITPIGGLFFILGWLLFAYGIASR